jgi:hypothetical protein
MTPFQKCLADTLTAALWADGTVEDSEIDYLKAKLSSLDVAGADLEVALTAARTKKAHQDVQTSALVGDEKDRVFQEAFIMVTIDRKGGPAERNFLKDLLVQFGYSEAEGKARMLEAAKAAKAAK